MNKYYFQQIPINIDGYWQISVLLIEQEPNPKYKEYSYRVVIPTKNILAQRPDERNVFLTDLTYPEIMTKIHRDLDRVLDSYLHESGGTPPISPNVYLLCYELLNIITVDKPRDRETEIYAWTYCSISIE